MLLGIAIFGWSKNPRFPKWHAVKRTSQWQARREENRPRVGKPRSKDDRSEHKIYHGSNMTKSLNPSKSSICDRIVFLSCTLLITVDHCWSLLITVVHLIQMCFSNKNHLFQILKCWPSPHIWYITGWWFGTFEDILHIHIPSIYHPSL